MPGVGVGSSPYIITYDITGASTPQYLVYEDSGDIYTLSGTDSYTDGTTTVRKVVRNNEFCVDITLTATGFSGTEGEDWENLFIHTGQTATYRYGFLNDEYVVQGWTGSAWETLASASIPSGDNVFRDGVRNAAYVIDEQVSSVYTNIETHD